MNLGVDVNPCFWYTPAYTPSLCPQSFKIVQKVCGGPFTSYVHFPPLEHSTWFSAWWSLSTWNKAIVRIDANFITWVLYPCRKYVMLWMILFLLSICCVHLNSILLCQANDIFVFDIKARMKYVQVSPAERGPAGGDLRPPVVTCALPPHAPGCGPEPQAARPVA